MDENSITILKSKEESIKTSFKKMKEKLKLIEKSDDNDKKILINYLKQELKNIISNYNLMKKEVNDLKLEENLITWKNIISQIGKKIKDIEIKINNLQPQNIELISNPNSNSNDYLNPDKKVDLNKLNIEQVQQRGDVIIKEDDKIIDNMIKTVNKDNDEMKEINKGLGGQLEQMGNVNTDLKEMNYSLERAKKQITNMFKVYSSDKIITCLIVFILIIIITIIIVSACGKDKNKNFNVPHDIFFSNNNNNETIRTSNLGKYLNNNKIIINNLFILLLSIFV